ncbi:capsular polysaccharide biosynthesis protein [Gimibacter soli]|uniref:Capsular polysaccharide biosynthesis protein n=1 Tax=Gimibacter soli TaxID=3024400 RepID=A0AAE9XPX6_9PROT|nr:hypothetical protein [Gimibacter soli]WCL55103.1 hypothetical protein PH603_04945 [Gimibacter soli]
MTGRILTPITSTMAKDKAIRKLLGAPVRRGHWGARAGDTLAGWGVKLNGQHIRAKAARTGLPYITLEDGFIGYLTHPSRDPRRLSLIVDRQGIYYDASRPSELEAILNAGDAFPASLLGRAEAAMALIRRWRLSKYNQGRFEVSPETQALIESHKGPMVLVVDQTAGDLSIGLGGASAETFTAMLEAAKAENPDALILVKVHPDVLAGQKKGHFGPESNVANVRLIADDCAPLALIERAAKVYVATSQMGFEALIAEKPVVCFGQPFYAGWGLTDDRQPIARRTAKRNRAELFAAACIGYCRYIDPYTRTPVELEHVLDLLVAERQVPRITAKTTYAVDFSLWKRGFIGNFLEPGAGRVRFVSEVALASMTFAPDDAIAVWGRKLDKLVETLPGHVPVWRIEDGFLRSVGLGSDLRRPSSLVVDGEGIYYDGGRVSLLETFLSTHEFSDRDLARGRALTDKILSLRLSKYNVGSRGSLDFKAKAAGRKVILVPGQVEGDASLRFGSPEVSANGALLQAVRAAEPEAYIVYKPHPDVVSGNREGAVAPEILASCADEIVDAADIIDCLEASAEVHTMTSQTGFEAILRGMPVVTYGMPFYAGWGLTTDRMAASLVRRGRGLPLEALVYAALVAYPRYVEWPSGRSTSPEALTEAMAKAAKKGKRVAARGPVDKLLGKGRKLRYLLSALLK